jgi:hypothetical protein
VLEDLNSHNFIIFEEAERYFCCRKAHLSSKKLLEQSQKIDKLWNHVLTGTLHLHADNWYNKVTQRALHCNEI